MLIYSDVENLLVLPFLQDFIDNEILPELTVESNSAVFQYPTTKKIIDLILNYSIYNSSFSKRPLEIKEMYILYVYATLLNKSIDHILYNTNLNFTRDQLVNIYYFPNIVFLLSTRLEKANSFIKKLLRKIYNEALRNQDKNLLFYTSFYKFDFNLLNNDILSIFLNNIIFEVNPAILEDYKNYYGSVFSYIFNLYLYDKSSNIVDFDIEPFLNQDTCLSTRYNIYKQSIRLTQIQGMCHESASLNKIYDNFNKVKHNILSNELQKLYSVLIDNDKFQTNKSLILKFNSDDEQILELKNKYPQIYTLLRSIKIKRNDDSSFNFEKNLIRQLLRDKLFISFKQHLNEVQASIMADTLSIQIETTITDGIYLDPFTLSVVEFSGDNFVKQLVDFVCMLLENSISSNNN